MRWTDVVPLIKNDAHARIGAGASPRRARLHHESRNRRARAPQRDRSRPRSTLRLAGQVAFARSVLRPGAIRRRLFRCSTGRGYSRQAGWSRRPRCEGKRLSSTEARDVQRVATLTRQYATAFATSLYAPDFFRDLARLIGRIGLADDASELPTLVERGRHPASRRPARFPVDARQGGDRQRAPRAPPPPPLPRRCATRPRIASKRRARASI